MLTTYTTIDSLPIGRFFKILETGCYGYLYPAPFEPESDNTNPELAETFQGLFYQFDELDLHSEVEIAGLLVLKLENAIKHSAARAHRIKQKESQIQKDRNEKSHKNQSFEDEIAAVEKWLGFHIDENTMSVKRYYAHKKRMIDEIERNSK